MHENHSFKILIVIVLYKQNLFECTSFKSIFSSELECIYKLFVYDNSPLSQHNVEELSDKGIYYIHDKNNPGVSAAYNKAAKFGRENNFNWILTLDQDTAFSPRTIKYYKQAIIEAESDKSICLIAPKLIADDTRTYSPAFNFFGRYFRPKELIPCKSYSLSKFSCMNSGMLIKIEKFYLVNGYDENLFYNSDHDFCFRLGKQGGRLYLSKVEAIHTPSGAKNTLAESETLLRFNMIMQDGFTYAEKLPLTQKIGAYSIIFTRATKIAITKKTFSPFKSIILFFKNRLRINH